MCDKVIPKFTEKDALFLARVMKHSTGKIEVDYKKVAIDMGLKNASTASARHGQIKRKLNELPFEPLAPQTSTTTVKKETTKRKVPDTEEISSKRAKVSNGRAKSVKNYDHEEVERDEERVMVKQECYVQQAEPNLTDQLDDVLQSVPETDSADISLEEAMKFELSDEEDATQEGESKL